MPSEIVSDLADLMSETLIATPGYTTGFGAFVASGTVLNISCLIEGDIKQVRDHSGDEAVSSVQAHLDGDYSLTTTKHRYTLPSRFPDPRTDIEAIAIEYASDENGAHHAVVMLP